MRNGVGSLVVSSLLRPHACVRLPATEPLEAVAMPTPPPANVKIKVVPRGKVVGFRCGTKTQRSPPKVRSEHGRDGGEHMR